MDLVYGTNMWSHHQAPIARELARLLGADRFTFAVFEDVPEFRRSVGWGEREDASWVAGPPSDPASRARLVERCVAADVMVFGDCPQDLLRARVAAKKLTLVASERLLRKRFHRLRLLNPRYALGLARYRRLVNQPFVHALTIGQHAPRDLRRIGAFADRMWRWGYLADVPQSPPPSTHDEPIRILWVGRMLRLKRVDLLLRALAQLRGERLIGECVLVGDGPDRPRLESLARRLGLLPGRVRFQSPVPFREVRPLMRTADVYVFPSDGREGWGVVANEAMSEGCVLVVNDAAGSAMDLVVDGETGLRFPDGDARVLADQLRTLATDRARRDRLRRAGWERAASLWSPAIAAERLVALSEALLHGEAPDYGDGPCSRVA